MFAKAELVDGLTFLAYTDSNHYIPMDSDKVELGGTNRAASPMEIVLAGLVGCTAMDVISILRKMRQDVRKFSVEAYAERAQQHPRVFTKIKLIYRVKGKDLDREKVMKAIKLSQEKYCGVSAMLRCTAEISYELDLEEI